jgi:hypothetical protein
MISLRSGLAPGAKVIVYDAPDTDAGFIDVCFWGLLNPMLYRFKSSFGGGASSPVVDIAPR